MVRPKVKATWVVIDDSGVMRCLRCGVSDRVTKAPALLELVRQINDFNNIHVNCLEPSNG